MSLAVAARAARWVAIAIAVAAAIDPEVSSVRRTRPEVALVRAPATADDAVVDRVRDRLDDAFTVIEAPFAGAAGTVLVGGALPDSTSELAAPAFAVVPAPDRASVMIERIDAPARSALESGSTIAVTARAAGLNGQRVDVSLHSGGLVVARVSWEVAADDARRVIELVYVPAATGAAPLRVVVASTGAAARASSDLVVDVREPRWSVLFFDPRPSWMSTFVRRAVERDPRFEVTSRVVTSRGVSTDVGRPPATPGDAAALASFDAIVVGSPDVLGERDIAGLETYLRARGGSVVMLLDQRATGAYQRLAGVHEWMLGNNAAGIAVNPAGSDSAGLRASGIVWPGALPPNARVLASGHVVPGDSAAPRPVIWQRAVGAGQLTVSGALDAWRYRDPAVSSFDAFWRSTIASAADAALPPITISLDETVVMPDERGAVSVTLRDASLMSLAPGRSVRAQISAALETPDGRIPIALWPAGPVGTLRGVFRAPAAPGTYRIVVTSDSLRADAPLVVASSVARTAGDDADLVAAWVASRHGRAIPEDRLDDLVSALENTLRPAPRRETWYPMRSTWWLLPFVALLGAEWFWRRRGGLA